VPWFALYSVASIKHWHHPTQQLIVVIVSPSVDCCFASSCKGLQLSPIVALLSSVTTGCHHHDRRDDASLLLLAMTSLTLFLTKTGYSHE
jgi:hypothetical protein